MSNWTLSHCGPSLGCRSRGGISVFKFELQRRLPMNLGCGVGGGDGVEVFEQLNYVRLDVVALV